MNPATDTTAQPPTDPCANFSFVLLADGTTLGGFSVATGLHRVTNMVGHRDGNATTAVRNLQDLGRFETVSLERGLTDAALLSHWHGRGRRGRHPDTLALLDGHRRLAIVRHVSHARAIQLLGTAQAADRYFIATELLDRAHEGLTPAD